MELKSLRYFLAVAREENMTKAADMLHVTQLSYNGSMFAMITSKNSLRNSFPSHWESTRIISGVLPVLVSLLSLCYLAIFLTVLTSLTRLILNDTTIKFLTFPFFSENPSDEKKFQNQAILFFLLP